LKYFSIWATAASQYDDDRALKRYILSSPLVLEVLLIPNSLKTRETFVQHAEQSLEEKKKHCMSMRNGIFYQSLMEIQIHKLSMLSKTL
jgi:hypothetical protein